MEKLILRTVNVAVGGTGATDDVALEHLDALAVAFGDAVVHLHRVAHAKLGDVLLHLLLFDSADVIHCSNSFYI